MVPDEYMCSNADAPTFSPRHGSTVIAKPHEEEQAFDEFLDYVMTQELGQDSQSAEVRYAQTRKLALAVTCAMR